MADPTTPNGQATIEIEAGDDAVYGLIHGFIRIPQWITHDPTLDVGHRYLYGVLLSYASIGAATGKGCIPGADTLANDCATSTDTVGRWLKHLRARGWLTWRRRPNRTSVYILYGPSTTDQQAGNAPAEDQPETANCGNRKPQIAGTGNRKLRDDIEEKELEEKNPPPPTPSTAQQQAPKGDGGGSSLRERYAPREQNNPVAQTETGSTALSKQVDTSLDAWWTANDRRILKVFNHIFSHWPKESGRQEAMGQFRIQFEAHFAADPDFGNRLWRVVQWQLGVWQKEDRAVQFVPSFANWLKRQSWRDAPGGFQL